MGKSMEHLTFDLNLPSKQLQPQARACARRDTKHPASPPWHRCLRVLRSKTRRNNRLGHHVSRKTLGLLENHHSVEPAFRNRLFLHWASRESYGSDPRRADTATTFGSTGLGRRQPPAHWGWPIFPAYDQVIGGGKSSKARGGRDFSAQDTEDPEPYLVNTSLHKKRHGRR